MKSISTGRPLSEASVDVVAVLVDERDRGQTIV